MDHKVIKGVLAKAKTVLTPTQYKYFVMFYGEDWSVDEIARKYGVSNSAVYGSISRARKRMRINWR